MYCYHVYEKPLHKAVQYIEGKPHVIFNFCSLLESMITTGGIIIINIDDRRSLSIAPGQWLLEKHGNLHVLSDEAFSERYEVEAMES